MTEVRLARSESPTCNTISVGPLTFVLSYETVVTFAVAGEGWTVCENVWSRTTGKHLNQEVGFIPKSDRLPRDVFEQRLAGVFERISIRPKSPMPPDAVEAFLQDA